MRGEGLVENLQHFYANSKFDIMNEANMKICLFILTHNAKAATDRITIHFGDTHFHEGNSNLFLVRNNNF